MRILLLVHAFNSLSQRLYVELARDGHELSVELDIHDRVTAEAVDLFAPDVILAPFLKRAARKSSLYHHEVTDAAVGAVREALARFAAGLDPWPVAAWGGRDGR